MVPVIHQESMEELAFLLSSTPPPFIFITDPIGPRTTARALSSTLALLSNEIRFVDVNAVACFTAKILFDTVLNGLAKWVPTWEEGCANWPGTADFARYNESLDAFFHGIRVLHSYLSKDGGATRLVIAIEQAERLKEKLPDLLVPLTRLAEFTRVDVSVIFLSAASWTEVRPPMGAAHDPYYIDISVPAKEVLIKHMTCNFHESQRQNEPNPYHPALASAYEKFAELLYDICIPFINDPDEISYIAAARWPGFIQPVLEDYARRLQRHHSEVDMDIDDITFTSPPENVLIRLMRYFKPSFTAALEQLYPRSIDAKAWADINKATDDALLHAFPEYRTDVPQRDGIIRQQSEMTTAKAAHVSDQYRELTRMSKFVLLAAYLASMNPARSDLRMFGRGVDEKKRKRRRVTRQTNVKPKSGPVKIPQRFLGPAIFPMDRMLAILGALLEDNDNDDESRAFLKTNFHIPGEYTDTEVTRVGVYSTIMNLTTAQLLQQTSAADKIDGPQTLKSGISHDVALAIAKDLDVSLNDLLWDTV